MKHLKDTAVAEESQAGWVPPTLKRGYFCIKDPVEWERRGEVASYNMARSLSHQAWGGTPN